MLQTILCGDLDLNLTHPHGTPALVPSAGLEKRMDLRLDPLNSELETISESPSLAIHLHVHYLDTLEALLDALGQCRDGLQGADLWVSTDSSAKAQAIRNNVETSSIRSTFQKVEVCVYRNRGRNLGPLLIDLWPELRGYNSLLHLHGKRSVESELGHSWREELLATLLPNSETVKLLRNQLARQGGAGLVLAQSPDLIRPYLNWGDNFPMAALLSKHLDRQLRRDSVLVFPAGMMFWCQPAALEPLVKLCHTLPELPPEPLAIDGTSLHALERLVVHCCEHAGFRWRMLCREAPSLTFHTPAELSVWEEQQDAFQEAAALLAAQLRHEHEQRHCADTNFAQCSEQLERHIRESSEQLQSADAQIRALMQDIHKIRNSWSWRLTSPLRLMKRTLRGRTH